MQNPLKWTWTRSSSAAVKLRGRHPLRHDVVELGVHFSGVSVDTLLGLAEPLPSASFVLAFSHTGYTTNLPLADVTGGKAWVVWDYAGSSLAVDHGGPARCSCRTCTSGRAPSGWRACGCWTTTSRASGRSTATTTGATPGSSSGTRATEPVTASIDAGDIAQRRAGAAPGPWQSATVEEVRRETARAKTFASPASRPVPFLAGQHFIVRLTAPDGYTASRSYSVASAPDGSGRIELSVEHLEGGEVSTFLDEEVMAGDELEVRGPIGGYFVWRGDTAGLLVGGGSGVVPLDGDAAPGQADGSFGPRPSRRLGKDARGPLLRRRASRPGIDSRLHPRGAGLLAAAARAPRRGRSPGRAAWRGAGRLCAGRLVSLIM